MTAKVISKVLEIDNCNDKLFLEALYKPKLWEELSPVTKIQVTFKSPNVFTSKIIDEVGGVGNLLKIPIEMEGDLVLIDKGEDPGKGSLIEFNVRNNKDVKELEGRIRVKPLAPNKAKIGVFIETLILSNDFLNLLGKGAAEMILRTKVTSLLRNLEKYCREYDLSQLI